MSQADTLYSARLPLPEDIEQGRANLLKCPVYRAGALAAPSLGTVSIWDASGTALVSAASVTVSGSIAQYSLASATVSASTLGEGWRIEWALTMPDSVIHTFRVDAALVHRRLYPVLTEADLYRVERMLDPSVTGVIHSLSSFADKIDEAWIQIYGRLISLGRRPWLVMSPHALRPLHLHMTLAMIFEDFSTTLNEAYAAKAERYRQLAAAQWPQTTYLEADADGSAGDGKRRAARPPVAWLGGAPSRWGDL